MGGRCRSGGGGLGRASSPLKERRTRGADCRLEPRQTHKANRRSQAPDAVMATVMQVARRELNLDRKKKLEAAEEWTIITERPMRNKRDKKREKTGETLRLSLISLIRSLACSLPGQTQRTQNHVQNFTPALENMTGLLFI